MIPRTEMWSCKNMIPRCGYNKNDCPEEKEKYTMVGEEKENRTTIISTAHALRERGIGTLNWHILKKLKNS